MITSQVELVFFHAAHVLRAPQDELSGEAAQQAHAEGACPRPPLHSLHASPALIAVKPNRPTASFPGRSSL